MYQRMMDDISKQIKAGTSMPRNMFLFNNAIYLLPYTGVGSGITRALDEDVNVTFMNNDKAQEFVITVWRGEGNQVEGKVTKSVTKSNKKVTKSRKKVTKSKTITLDLDTLTPTMTLDLDTLAPT